jgi:hypothetical protein
MPCRKLTLPVRQKKTTKEIIEHFDKFKIGERQEEDDSLLDSSLKDDVTLSQLTMQTNVVGNPALKEESNRKQRRL